MSSAETTHPIEWRDDGAGGARAYVGDEVVGSISAPSHPFPWTAEMKRPASDADRYRRVRRFPTASAARSFVEKSVKEAGHDANS